MVVSQFEIGKFTVEFSSSLNTEQFHLSPREREILTCLIAGQSVKDAAEQLNVSPHTVDVFKRRIFKKLGVHNAASAAALGMAALLGARIETTPDPVEPAIPNYLAG